MAHRLRIPALATSVVVLAAVPFMIGSNRKASPPNPAAVTVHAAAARDVSPRAWPTTLPAGGHCEKRCWRRAKCGRRTWAATAARAR